MIETVSLIVRLYVYDIVHLKDYTYIHSDVVRYVLTCAYISAIHKTATCCCFR